MRLYPSKKLKTTAGLSLSLIQWLFVNILNSNVQPSSFLRDNQAIPCASNPEAETDIAAKLMHPLNGNPHRLRRGGCQTLPMLTVRFLQNLWQIIGLPMLNTPLQQ